MQQSYSTEWVHRYCRGFANEYFDPEQITSPSRMRRLNSIVTGQYGAAELNKRHQAVPANALEVVEGLTEAQAVTKIVGHISQ